MVGGGKGKQIYIYIPLANLPDTLHCVPKRHDHRKSANNILITQTDAAGHNQAPIAPMDSKKKKKKRHYCISYRYPCKGTSQHIPAEAIVRGESFIAIPGEAPQRTVSFIFLLNPADRQVKVIDGVLAAW